MRTPTPKNVTNDKQTGEPEGVFARSGNVFADLDLPDPEVRLAKARLAQAIRARVREYGLNQTETAAYLGTTQARVSEVMNGKIGRMSYELLLDYLLALDCDVQITVLPRPAPKRGQVLVGTF